jgi:Outer membrane protein beta-barrel domain
MRLSPLAFLVLSVSPATAQDAGYYAKLFGGISSLQGDSADLGGTAESLSYDGGTIYGGAFGYDYGDRPFRAELEFAYRSDEAAGAISGDYASTSFMLNGYYLFSRGRLTPYAGLGLGYVTEIDFDVTGGPGIGEYSDRGLLAWQATVGADYTLSDSVSLFGELRYFATEPPRLDGPGGATLGSDYDSIDILAGLSFRF